MCAQRTTRPVSKDWGGNNAAEHRISGSAGSCCPLVWPGAMGNQVIADSMIPGFCRNTSVCHINCHQSTARYTCAKSPNPPLTQGPPNLSIGENCGT